jgi:hypothetical protein
LENYRFVDSQIDLSEADWVMPLETTVAMCTLIEAWLRSMTCLNEMLNEDVDLGHHLDEGHYVHDSDSYGDVYDVVRSRSMQCRRRHCCCNRVCLSVLKF